MLRTKRQATSGWCTKPQTTRVFWGHELGVKWDANLLGNAADSSGQAEILHCQVKLDQKGPPVKIARPLGPLGDAECAFGFGQTTSHCLVSRKDQMLDVPTRRLSGFFLVPSKQIVVVLVALEFPGFRPMARTAHSPSGTSLAATSQRPCNIPPPTSRSLPLGKGLYRARGKVASALFAEP